MLILSKQKAWVKFGENHLNLIIIKKVGGIVKIWQVGIVVVGKKIYYIQ
jgi:hypothetical protein